jgi:hypothetical protein
VLIGQSGAKDSIPLLEEGFARMLNGDSFQPGMNGRQIAGLAIRPSELETIASGQLRVRCCKAAVREAMHRQRLFQAAII